MSIDRGGIEVDEPVVKVVRDLYLPTEAQIQKPKSNIE
jgi:hypothetical protein